MKFKHILTLILIMCMSVTIAGCSQNDTELDNTVNKQKFALDYFKTLAIEENTVVSPLLALVTVGELSGISKESVVDDCMDLLNNDEDPTKFNTDCGRILKNTCGNVSDSGGYGYNYATNNIIDRTSGFSYSSDFMIKFDDKYDYTGFDSVYDSNLSNLYRGRVNAYTSEDQYTDIVNSLDSFGEIKYLHEYNENNLSLFNSITYSGDLVQDYIVLESCNIKNKLGKNVPGVLCEDPIYYSKSDTTLSCEIYTGDVSISLLLMMPTDEDMELNEYIANITHDELSEIINSCKYDAWCKTDGSQELYCAFPEISSSSLIKDNDTYSKIGLDAIVSSKLNLDKPHNKVKVHNIVQHTGIDFKATSANLNEYIEDITMVFDRPFIYALIENESGYPVIMGRIDNI